MPQKSIPYGRQDINQEDIDAVVRTLKSDFLTQGPDITAFEKKFSEYIGCTYAVAVSNGTAALHLCALALNVDANAKVITTPITFAASSNCIEYCGGDITFVDIDPETALLDLNKVEALLKKFPKGTYSGIIPVDFAGYPVQLERLKKIADEFGLWIIEDACHAPGGYFIDSNNKKQNCGNGNFADLAIFSFHPVKHIATGEGGMITTNNKDLYDKLCLLRTHGITKDPNLLEENHGGWYYEMQILGYNYRLSDMQASLGISQLSRAEENIKKRIAIAKKYDQAFEGTPIKPLKLAEGVGHAFHLFIIQIENRKGLYDYLRDHNIMAQVHYIPVHRMPYYKQKYGGVFTLPIAEAYYENCLSIPMYPTLTEEEQSYVIEKIKEFYSI